MTTWHITPPVLAIATAVIRAHSLREESFDKAAYALDDAHFRGLPVKTPYYKKRLEDCALEASEDYAAVVFIMLKTSRAESLDWALNIVRSYRESSNVVPFKPSRN